MNVLKRDKQVLAVAMLAEGSSVRAVERVTKVHRDTILRLLVRAGERCDELTREHMQQLCFNALELDEAWTFCVKKQRNCKPGDPATWGDQYVYVAQCPETKVVPYFQLGRRCWSTTQVFVRELRRRLDAPCQLSTDGFGPYRDAVREYFGRDCHYMMIIKKFAAESTEVRRYNPPHVVGMDRIWISGSPRGDRACTSHVEAQNAGLRTHTKRLARLTLCCSKKWGNLLAALQLHFAAFNFVRRHTALGTVPAVAAGLIARPWTMADLLP